MSTSRFKKYLRDTLATSANHHLLDMKDRGWYMRPNSDVVAQKWALLRDATANLTFNGHSFAQYADARGLDTETIDDNLEREFKVFLKDVLLPNLSPHEFENEYKRLDDAYVQSILHEGYHVVCHGTCKQIINEAESKDIYGVEASVSKKASHDLTYQNGTFTVTSETSSLVFNHIDAAKYKTAEPVKFKIPGTIISSYQMQHNEEYFSFDCFKADSYFLNTVLFKANVDVPRLLLDDTLDRLINAEGAIPTLYEGCKNYKEHLKEDLFKGLVKIDAVLASQLKNPSYGIDPNVGNIVTTGTGLDLLIADPKMEEKIKYLPKPEQFAIKKYKAITAIEKKMDSEACALDKGKAFIHGVYDNLPLLRTSRDGYFTTFMKMVVSVFSFGTLAPTLFGTQADSFINNSVSLLFSPSKKSRQHAAPILNEAPQAKF